MDQERGNLHSTTTAQFLNMEDLKHTTIVPDIPKNK